MEKLTLEQIQDFKGKYPKQLYMLFFAEMWERFTFYGMRALLMLFMTKQLMYADDVSNLKYGAYNAFVYAMGIFGGLFADKFLGSRKAIRYGGVMMAIGSFTLVLPFEISFYLGLGIIIVGNGFFKPNISTMVGQLYKPGDNRRDAGFSLFYSGINFGAFFGSLLCGWIGETISWHLGFGIAGVFMLAGLFVFFRGQHKLGPIGLPPNPEKLKAKYFLGLTTEQFIYVSSILLIPLYVLMLINHEIVDYIMIPLVPVSIIYIVILGMRESREAMRKLMAALILICFSMLFWAFYEQGGGSLNLFADRNVNMEVNTKEQLKLDAPAMAGDTTLTIASAYNIKKGNVLWITDGSIVQTYVTIDSVSDNNVAFLEQPLKYNFTPEAVVEKKFVMSSAAVNNSVNPLYIIIFSPLIGLFWIFLAKRKAEPNSAVKFALGLILLGAGYLIFQSSSLFGNQDGRVPLWIFMGGYFVITMGELCLSPIGLSMVTKLSPAKMVGLMMGMWFLASAFGQYLAGWIGATISAGNDTQSVKGGVESLNLFTNAFGLIGWISIGSGIVLFALSPFLRKFMGNVK